MAIFPSKLDQLLEPAGSLEEGVGQVERERGAIGLLPGFEVVEEPTDVGEEEIADLGFVLERRFDVREGVFQIPMLVGERKRRPDLFEARDILPLA